MLLTQFVQTRGRIAGIQGAHGHTLIRQVADHGAAGNTQANNQIERVFRHIRLRPSYRILRVARPTSTRITVMIQNRTMIFGSGQPLSSKW